MFEVMLKNKGSVRMGLSKSDIEKRKRALKAKLALLEAKAANDPLKRDRALHEEVAEIKKKLAECD